MPERGKVSQTFMLKVGVWVSMRSGNGSARGGGTGDLGQEHSGPGLVHGASAPEGQWAGLSYGGVAGAEGAGGLRDAGTLGFYSEPGRVWEGSQQGGRHAFCCKDHYDHDNGTRQATSGPVV